MFGVTPIHGVPCVKPAFELASSGREYALVAAIKVPGRTGQTWALPLLGRLAVSALSRLRRRGNPRCLRTPRWSRSPAPVDVGLCRAACQAVARAVADAGALRHRSRLTGSRLGVVVQAEDGSADLALDFLPGAQASASSPGRSGRGIEPPPALKAEVDVVELEHHVELRAERVREEKDVVASHAGALADPSWWRCARRIPRVASRRGIRAGTGPRSRETSPPRARDRRCRRGPGPSRSG